VLTSKEEVSSPTVSLEAMVLSCAIDVKENRYVVVTDIPGAFLHADMEDDVHMLLEGTIVELIIKWNQVYTGNMSGTTRKGNQCSVQAALLFWKQLSNTLQEWGFKINEYNLCVSNKTIKGKQCTIAMHVNDLKISHVDKDLVEEIIKKLMTKFGQDSP